MRYGFPIAVCGLILMVCVAPAQAGPILPGQGGSWMKVEDGLIVSWRVNSSDPNVSQVDLFEPDGRPIARIKVLQAARDAKEVSITDVAVRSGSLIAVAAVYSKGDNSMPAGALLCYNFAGRLESMFALAPSRSVLRLAIDERLNIWTLTTSSGDQDPSEVPMVVGYDIRGRVIADLLKRNEFPLHAGIVEETPATGPAAFGYSAGALWFWLPGTTDFVTIRLSDRKIDRTKTDLPREGSSLVVERVFRHSSGDLILEAMERPAQGQAAALTYYKWLPGHKQWAQLEKPSCEGRALIGLDANGYVFAGFERGGPADLCTSSLTGGNLN